MGKIKELSREEFERMHMLQVDMVKELDRVCRANNINYVLSDGSLLGAVRHKGFIPWDDDVDVSMLREDYEKFRKVSNQLDPEICYFQDHGNEKEYRWGYGKLRRTGTKFVRVGQEHMTARTGVFIDIFPLDDVPMSVPGQILQNFHAYCLRKIMYSEVGKVADDESKFARFVYRNLAKIDIDKVFKSFNKMAYKSRNSKPNRVRILAFPPTGAYYRKNPLKERYGMPKRWFLERAEYDFEGLKIYGTKAYDEFLSYEYGDYMKLPPEDQRDPHAPVSEYYF